MVLPVDLGHGRLGLGAGGVDDEHTDRAEPAGNGSHQLGALVLIGDVAEEGLGDAAIVPDPADDVAGVPVVPPAVHGDCEPVARQALGDDAARIRGVLPVTSATRGGPAGWVTVR